MSFDLVEVEHVFKPLKSRADFFGHSLINCQEVQSEVVKIVVLKIEHNKVVIISSSKHQLRKNLENAGYTMLCSMLQKLSHGHDFKNSQ